MFNLIRKWLKLPMRKGDVVIGVTTSSDTTSATEYRETLNDHFASIGRYRLRQSDGLHFTLLDITQDPTTKQPLYSIRCIETDDKFKLSKHLFTLLFERELGHKAQDIFSS